MNKICSSCNEEKTINQFEKGRNVCRKCRAKQHKNRYNKNPDKHIKYVINKRLKKKYNLTYDDKLNLLYKQNNQCAICKTINPGKKGWQIDHCHTTNEIRGILCSSCNLGLGLFKDNIKILWNAIKYLLKGKILK